MQSNATLQLGIIVQAAIYWQILALYHKTLFFYTTESLTAFIYMFILLTGLAHSTGRCHQSNHATVTLCHIVCYKPVLNIIIHVLTFQLTNNL